MSMSPPRRSRCEQGLAAVEFTIALPLLLLLLLATAEIGRMLSQYDTLTKAVRDGARFLAAHALSGSTGTVQLTAPVPAQTQYLVVYGNTNGTGTALLPGLAVGNVTVADAGNGYVSVSAVYTYQPMIGTSLPTFGFGSPISTNIPLTATVVMRAL
jgi:Flp pilus assembly protein TadG